MTTLQRLQALQQELALIADEMTQEEKDAGYQDSVVSIEDSLSDLVLNMGGDWDEEEDEEEVDSTSESTEEDPDDEKDPAVTALEQATVTAFKQAQAAMTAASTVMLAAGWDRDSFGWQDYLAIDQKMSDFIIELQA